MRPYIYFSGSNRPAKHLSPAKQPRGTVLELDVDGRVHTMEIPVRLVLWPHFHLNFNTSRSRLKSAMQTNCRSMAGPRSIFT